MPVSCQVAQTFEMLMAVTAGWKTIPVVNQPLGSGTSITDAQQSRSSDARSIGQHYNDQNSKLVDDGTVTKLKALFVHVTSSLFAEINPFMTINPFALPNLFLLQQQLLCPSI